MPARRVWYKGARFGGSADGWGRGHAAHRAAQRRFTQRQLADELGVEAITVSRWERGVTSPSLPRLRRIAELTGTTVSDLVCAPDASSAHALELAALREELAETRELVHRIAQTLERMSAPAFVEGSVPASRER